MKMTALGLNKSKLYNFFKGKSVLLTGHTGFKGSWMSLILNMLEAKVCGVALNPESNPNLYDILKIQALVKSNIIDINDYNALQKIYDDFDPDIVIHMAAQALVSKSYQDPIATYRTNVMGTVTLFDVIRTRKNKKNVLILNVTTDKVYKNNEWFWPYRETDELNGHDPYSNSKSCVELLSDSYYNSFFQFDTVNLVNVRAGNVIGGGDFSENRIVPDCVNAIISGKEINLRNPNSIRPYQHVLEPLFAYLELIKKYYKSPKTKIDFNIGPSPNSTITTKSLAELIINSWPIKLDIVYNDNPKFKESNLLKLDSSKIAFELGWSPRLSLVETIKYTTKWYKNYFSNEDVLELTKSQIIDYMSKSHES